VTALPARLGALAASLAAATCLLLAPGTAAADQWVNCDTEGSQALADVLGGIGDGNGTTIHVSGTCYGPFRGYNARNFTLRGPATLNGRGLGTTLEIYNPHLSQKGWVKLEHMTVTGGAPQGSSAGGGVRVHGFDLTIVSSRILGNSSNAMGAGVSDGGPQPSLRIQGTYIGENRGPDAAGASVFYGDAHISESNITKNESYHGGGAVSAIAGTLTLTSDFVTENTAGEGAAAASGQKVVVNRTTVANNRSKKLGAAIRSDNGTVIVEHSSVIGNEGGAESFAGALMGHVVLRNSTIANNVGSIAGGIYGYTVNATATTFHGNRATDSTGSAGAIFMTRGAPTLRASILAGDHGASPECRSAGGAPVSGGYNLVAKADGCNWLSPAAGDLIGTTAAPVAAHLGALTAQVFADVRLSVRVLPLLPASPALNAIPAASCPFNVDELSQSRPHGPGCDIGAVEQR
jgi:hypothetical protein